MGKSSSPEVSGSCAPLSSTTFVEELRLMIYPVVLGDGERLFGKTSSKKPMRLVDSRTLDDGLVYLTYQRAPKD